MQQTWLTERLGLRYPIIGAPMAGVAGGKLAHAISEAGGFGMIGVATNPPQFIEQEASIAREGGKPFGIGLLIWALQHNPDLVDAAIAARPALISVSFGSTAPYVERLHREGILVATQVNSVAAAREAEAAGVDVIVAQGTEAGGHSNAMEVGTLTLLQGVLDAMQRPVLAAGGIGTARGLAAVLAAGAAGAWIGTAFLACPECTNTDEVRQRVIAARETDTVLTGVYDRIQRTDWPQGNPGRALRNRFTDRWHGHIGEMMADDEATREYQQARAGGDYDVAHIYAGQSVGLVTRQRLAAEVVQGIGEGAEKLLRDIAGNAESAEA